MQDVPGMQHRINTLQFNDLESISSEMECAKLIFHPNHQLQFNEPKSNAPKGSCYDAEFRTTEGRIIHCEFKKKTKNTVMSAKSVSNTCQDARKQLPKGKPGIIFLRLPEEWSCQPNFKEIIKPGLEQSVRQSDLLVAIVIAWERWLTNGGSARACLFLYDSWLNRRSRLFCEDVERSIQLFKEIPTNWFEIKTFVASTIEDLKRRIPMGNL